MYIWCVCALCKLLLFYAIPNVLHCAHCMYIQVLASCSVSQCVLCVYIYIARVCAVCAWFVCALVDHIWHKWCLQISFMRNVSITVIGEFARLAGCFWKLPWSIAMINITPIRTTVVLYYHTIVTSTYSTHGKLPPTLCGGYTYILDMGCVW